MSRILTAFLFGLAVPFLAVLVLAYLGRLPVHGTANPSWVEAVIANRAVHTRLTRDAAGLRNPLQGTQDVLMAGMKTYRDGCAGCHGVSGKASQWGTRNFYPRAPQFADHPPKLPAPEMFVAVKHGIRYSGMAGWDGLVSDDDIWQVVTFLSELKHLPPDVARAWTTGS
ncbi:MAG: c-type cytochrome [Candidatus Eiseniibacteriota bacterium]